MITKKPQNNDSAAWMPFDYVARDEPERKNKQCAGILLNITPNNI